MEGIHLKKSTSRSQQALPVHLNPMLYEKQLYVLSHSIRFDAATVANQPHRHLVVQGMLKVRRTPRATNMLHWFALALSTQDELVHGNRNIVAAH
jgi:hypothetical protein